MCLSREARFTWFTLVWCDFMWFMESPLLRKIISICICVWFVEKWIDVVTCHIFVKNPVGMQRTPAKRTKWWSPFGKILNTLAPRNETWKERRRLSVIPELTSTFSKGKFWHIIERNHVLSSNLKKQCLVSVAVCVFAFNQKKYSVPPYKTPLFWQFSGQCCSMFSGNAVFKIPLNRWFQRFSKHVPQFPHHFVDVLRETNILTPFSYQVPISQVDDLHDGESIAELAECIAFGWGKIARS